jgi:hypothetical protein
LDNAVVEALLGTSSKNYTRHSVEEIREHITEDLR